MKTKTSAKSVWLRSLVLLPLLSILIYGFSEKVTIEKVVPQTQKENINSTQTKILESPIEELENSNQVNYLEKQDGATKEQVAEYNKLAKHYNTMPKDNLIIKNKEVKRMHYIYYKLMNDAQRTEVEPYPSLPPPPPAKNSPSNELNPEDAITGFIKLKGTIHFYVTQQGRTNYYNRWGQKTDKTGTILSTTQTNGDAVIAGQKITKVYKNNAVVVEFNKNWTSDEGTTFQIPPPPPPAAANETLAKGSDKLQKVFKKFSEQSKLYVKAIKQYKETGENYDQVSANYKKVLEYHQDYKELAVKEGLLPSPPPPPITPPNPIDHMIEMAKKGAVFYYEDKKITSDKAIDIAKKNKDINILIHGNESSMPIVKLSTKPIVLGKK